LRKWSSDLVHGLEGHRPVGAAGSQRLRVRSATGPLPERGRLAVAVALVIMATAVELFRSVRAERLATFDGQPALEHSPDGCNGT